MVSEADRIEVTTLSDDMRRIVLRYGFIDNVTVPIFHGAAITGRVLDANGDPLDNAQPGIT